MRLAEPSSRSVFRRRSRHAGTAAATAGAIALVCWFASKPPSLSNGTLPRAAINADSRRETGYVLNRAHNDEYVRGAAESRGHGNAVVLATHDFGIIRPRSVSKCEFIVRNDGHRSWVLDKARVNCVCTVARVSFTEIPSGETGFATVQLRAGDHVGDVRKSVVLEFKHGVPPVVLPVFAAVRQPMTPDTHEVAFSNVRPKASDKRMVAIRNFSDLDWGSVRVEDSPTWVKVSISRLRKVMQPRRGRGGAIRGTDGAPAAGSPHERQSLALTVALHVGELIGGYHNGPIKLRADTGDTCVLQVSAHVTPTVRVVPDTMLFGPVTAETREPRSVRIILAEPNPASITAAATPISGSAPRLSVLRIDDRTWQLRAMPPVDHNPSARGDIRVTLPLGLAPREISVPYTVFSADAPQIVSSAEAKP